MRLTLEGETNCLVPDRSEMKPLDGTTWYSEGADVHAAYRHCVSCHAENAGASSVLLVSWLSVLLRKHYAHTCIKATAGSPARELIGR